MNQIKPTIRPLMIWPHEKLRTACEPIDHVRNDNTQQLIADLKQTVQHHEGYGLAAPQVGELFNVFVVRFPYTDPIGNTENMINATDGNGIASDRIYTMVNPELVEVDDHYTFSWDEGCLSVPGYFEKRQRPQRIVIRYQNEHGHTKEHEAQGFAAFVVQHEYDHLLGKVFVDELSRLKQQRVKKKIAKTLKRSKENV